MISHMPTRCPFCGAPYRRARPDCTCLRRWRLWGGLAAALLLVALLTAGILALDWLTAPVPYSPPAEPRIRWTLPPPPLPGTPTP
jgi:hypothetical protein